MNGIFYFGMLIAILHNINTFKIHIMKNSKESLSSTGQSTKKTTISQKHDTNLQKNGTLYFQIGLILCLLAAYSLFEMQFQKKVIKINN